jgi:hypothetical protein
LQRVVSQRVRRRLSLVIRPILGRLHCGVFAVVETELPYLVVRPILGRLHCGIGYTRWDIRANDLPSGRSLTGSIAVSRAEWSEPVCRRIVRPVLGRLHHCGHPASGASIANLELMSGRSLAGSIAVPGRITGG